MNTIIAALVSGICGIVVALITLTPKLNKILERLGDGAGCGNLSNGQTKLSNEHSGISSTLESTRREALGQMHGLSQDVRVLREEQIRTMERQSSLTNKQLDITHTVEQITALTTELARLQAENLALHQQLDRYRPARGHQRGGEPDWDEQEL